MNVFDFMDYKEYLRWQIEANALIRGYKSNLATAANCQRTYISQVLNTHVHLTPEHGVGLAQFWNLMDLETDYWLGLIDLGRTSFEPLRKKILQRITSIKNEQDNFAKIFNEDSIDDLQNQLTYYSSWLYAASHMITGIKNFQDQTQIAKKLNISVESTTTILTELAKMGLVKKESGKWHRTSNKIHLPRISELNLLNHQIWRNQALVNIQTKSPSDLHYSSIQTLDEKTFDEIKKLIHETIDKQRKLVVPSKDEELAVFVCDWFKI